ncbi:hypothetical protein LH47_01393 [Anoxybacillus thermarum]|uniref:Uncharacterized protein n=1 Tax=Anoxybacillus thermarum TaxID=404937 RepID=A0A0D0RYW6_9BACL|nr:hypothetical protein [Anoxybacillus thermarum]KIQ94515.1 hypothetical protein LH47_01393 [Anoxybacillus thermarum]
MEKKLLPQILMPGTIKKSDVNEQSFNIINEENIKKISRIVKKLPQDDGTIVVWLLVDPSFQKYELTSLQQKIELWLEKKLGDEWDVEAMTIVVDHEWDIEKLEDDIERLVHKLCVQYPFSYFAQIPTFGDPIVYQILFLEGVRQFTKRYATIYFDGENVHVEHTVLAIHSETWMKQFRDFIIDHDYEAALEMMKDIEETEETIALKSLLHMMIDRLNFAFEDSLAHLKIAMMYLSDEDVLLETKKNLELLLDKNMKKRDLARIVELYRHIDMYLDMDDVISLLIRFYRVREAILFYLLQHAQTIPYTVEFAKKSTIYEVFDELEEKYSNWEIDGYYGAYFYLKSANVAGALNVRNHSFIGHSRNKVDVKTLWNSYFGTSRTTYTKAKRRFIMDTMIMLRDLGVMPDENIMDINRLLLQLSRKIVLKGK